VTEKKTFQSRLNPHELKRREQLMSGLLWYAAYDMDINEGSFVELLNRCNYKRQSQEQRSLKIIGFKVAVDHCG
jgi:hypothetical protein